MIPGQVIISPTHCNHLVPAAPTACDLCKPKVEEKRKKKFSRIRPHQ